jgi:hypothetical protein
LRILNRLEVGVLARAVKLELGTLYVGTVAAIEIEISKKNNVSQSLVSLINDNY